MIKLESQKRKLLAPIIISVIVILYYVVYFVFLVAMLEGIRKYILGIVPVILSVLMVKVCMERIREIKGGEEDDLGKY